MAEVLKWQVIKEMLGSDADVQNIKDIRKDIKTLNEAKCERAELSQAVDNLEKLGEQLETVNETLKCLEQKFKTLCNQVKQWQQEVEERLASGDIFQSVEAIQNHCERQLQQIDEKLRRIQEQAAAAAASEKKCTQAAAQCDATSAMMRTSREECQSLLAAAKAAQQQAQADARATLASVGTIELTFERRLADACAGTARECEGLRDAARQAAGEVSDCKADTERHSAAACAGKATQAVDGVRRLEEQWKTFGGRLKWLFLGSRGVQ